MNEKESMHAPSSGYPFVCQCEDPDCAERYHKNMCTVLIHHPSKVGVAMRCTRVAMHTGKHRATSPDNTLIEWGQDE